MAKISIIVPCYNGQDYICKCLDSFQMQTYKDFDVIIVNDCSKDNTVRVVEDWVKQHCLSVTIATNEKNSGPSLSRLNGAKLSRSKWVTFCDSDDWFEPDYLQKMMTKVLKDQCDLVFCGYRNVIGTKLDNHPLADSQLVLNSKDAMYLNVDSLCMTLVRRDIYITIPQPNIRNGEDMALVPLLIQNATKIGVLSDVLYNYNIRMGSASLSPSDNMIDSLVMSFNHINAYLDKNYSTEKEYLGIRNLIYGCLLNLFKYSYNTQKAQEILIDFEKDYPYWIKNNQVSKLPLFKRLYVWCAYHRFYLLMWFLSRIHSIMLK